MALGADMGRGVRRRGSHVSLDVLASKLRVPPLPPGAVPRPDLVQRMGALRSRRVGLLSAGAGFGKTTLLSEWQSSPEWRNQPIAWLSIDPTDNDPTRFWQYCASALQAHCLRGDDSVRRLQRANTRVAPFGLPGALLASIDPAAPPFWLVLDDLHLIESPEVLEGLAYLVEHLPDNMHLVVAGRREVPLPLARLRAQGELFELHERDLRFSRTEAQALLEGAGAPSLPTELLDSLHDKTEGWVAGLRLASQALLDAEDAGTFVASFAGNHRYIADYLVEEVLDRQPKELRQFLLVTAVPEVLTAALCDVLTGQSGSADVLRQLESRNLFLVPLDETRRWYRYHHLFRDLLREQLLQQDGSRVRQLSLHASRWYEDQGLPEEAIRHAFLAGDAERAATLIEQTGEALFLRGHHVTLLGWLDQLPSRMLQSRRKLQLFQTRLLFLTGQTDLGEAHLLLFESNLRASPTAAGEDLQVLHGNVLGLRAMQSAVRGEIPRAIQLATDALRRPHGLTPQHRAILANALATAYLAAGEPEAAIRVSQDAISLSRAAGMLYVVMDSYGYLARGYLLRGSLGQALKTYQSALRTEGGDQRSPALGIVHVGIAEVLYERNELHAAAEHVTIGLRLGELCGMADMQLWGYLLRARLYRVTGDTRSALEAVRCAEEVAQRYNIARVLNLVSARRAELSLAMGDVEAAHQWTREYERAKADLPGYVTEVEDLALAEIWVADGVVGAQRACALLDDVIAAARRCKRTGSLVRALLVRALALQVTAGKGAAQAALQEAVFLGEPEGYVRTFLDEGPALMPLLQELFWTTGMPQERRYVGKLLTAVNKWEGAPPRRQPDARLLSWRELEVLRLLPTHFDAEEMAARLTVSANTVRTHMKHIYRKLGVNDRSGAVSQAQQLNLI